MVSLSSIATPCMLDWQTADVLHREPCAVDLDNRPARMLDTNQRVVKRIPTLETISPIAWQLGFLKQNLLDCSPHKSFSSPLLRTN
jgi:hypothetical protein